MTKFGKPVMAAALAVSISMAAATSASAGNRLGAAVVGCGVSSGLAGIFAVITAGWGTPALMAAALGCVEGATYGLLTGGVHASKTGNF